MSVDEKKEQRDKTMESHFRKNWKKISDLRFPLACRAILLSLDAAGYDYIWRG
jgi:hypothetical protein